MSGTAVTSARPRSRHVRYATMLPLGLMAAFVAVAVFAPYVAPYDPNQQNLLGRLKAPGFVSRGVTYWSDELGRDLLSRLIYGARISLFVAFASVILSGTVGVLLGMLAGYLRGPVEVIIMRVVDIFLSIPAILLAIITVAVLGPGLVNVIVVLALTRWPRYARVAYGQTLGIANMPYVWSCSRRVSLSSALVCSLLRRAGARCSPRVETISPLLGGSVRSRDFACSCSSLRSIC